MPRKSADQRSFENRPLGYIRSEDRRHIEKFPLRAADLRNATRPKTKFHTVSVRYDQGNEGACVGASSAAFASYYNHRRSVLDGIPGTKSAKFDWWRLYKDAQGIDEWEGDDYDGTSVRAGLEVLRTTGVKQMTDPNNIVRIQEYRWATNLEDILNFLAFKGPVVFGMDWYSNFDNPKRHPFNGFTVDQYFIGEDSLGSVRGGHAIIAHAYRRLPDGTEWIRLQNSWGFSYPLVWMPAPLVGNMLDNGTLEAGMITGLPFGTV